MNVVPHPAPDFIPMVKVTYEIARCHVKAHCGASEGQKKVYGTKGRVNGKSGKETGAALESSASASCDVQRQALKVNAADWQYKSSLRQSDIIAVKAAASYLEARREDLKRQQQELESLEDWVWHNTGPGLRPGPGFKQQWEVAQQVIAAGARQCWGFMSVRKAKEGKKATDSRLSSSEPDWQMIGKL